MTLVFTDSLSRQAKGNILSTAAAQAMNFILHDLIGRRAFYPITHQNVNIKEVDINLFFLVRNWFYPSLTVKYEFAIDVTLTQIIAHSVGTSCIHVTNVVTNSNCALIYRIYNNAKWIHIMRKILGVTRKTQYLDFSFHANYFLLPWKILEEISGRSMLFHY